MSNSTAAHPTIWVREKKLKIRDLHLKQLHRLQCYINLKDILFALLGYLTHLRELDCSEQMPQTNQCNLSWSSITQWRNTKTTWTVKASNIP